MRQGIAIVGMACEYPGASSPSELWDNVLAQRQWFRRIPDERLNLEDYFSPETHVADKTYTYQAALIEGYRFDRISFRISGTTFRAADLVHWLALDVAARALADAGYPEARGLPRESTGILLGNSLTGEFSRAGLMRLRWPYVRRVLDANLARAGWQERERALFLLDLEKEYKQPFPEIGSESLAGGLANTIAGRICNYFDLQGGGYTVDGACSSSLLAVINACSALAAGDMDVVLAGGVDLSLDPFELVGFAKTGALAPHTMRVFDKRAAGFIPGEGCGILVLRRLEDALAEGLRIYAVIRGWGVSSDGKGGLTRPEVGGQSLAMRRAYARAGFSPASVAYFEGHGTGTAVGDRTELTTILEALGESASGAVLGSIKANIGHTKAAAGAASLIKATLALHSQIRPPATSCEQVHDLLENSQSTLCVPDHGERWPEDKALRAAVSAMGFGGINTHLVLEGLADSRRPELDERERRLLASPQDAELFAFSAPSTAELRSQLAAFEARVGSMALAEMPAVASRLQQMLTPGTYRAVIVAGRIKDLRHGLAGLLAAIDHGETSHFDAQTGSFMARFDQKPRLGFLFPGHAAPIHAIKGAFLRRFPWIAEAYEQTLSAAERQNPERVTQAAIVLGSALGMELLGHFGIRAVTAAGHSLGELAAYHWAGILNREDLVALAKLRNEYMDRRAAVEGGMVSINADPEQVGVLIAGKDLVISAYNGPRRTVVSGSSPELDSLQILLKSKGIEHIRLRVPHPFHSPLMAEAGNGFASSLAPFNFSSPGSGLLSTITGGFLDSGSDPRKLLADQFTQPVHFQQVMEIASDSVDLWIEVGAGSVIAGLAAPLCRAPVINSDFGGLHLEPLLKALGAAWALGADVHLERLFSDRELPVYDWEKPLTFFANPCEMAPQTVLDLNSLTGSGLDAGAIEAESTAALKMKRVSASHDGLAPLDLLRTLIARRTELPLDEVGDDYKMLDDFHLNSITVAAIVAEAAKKLGLPAPVSPTDYANATVSEIARVFSDLEAGNLDVVVESEMPPAGVDQWVAFFQARMRPAPALGAAVSSFESLHLLGAQNPVTEALRQTAEQTGRSGGSFAAVIAWAPAGDDLANFELFLRAARVANSQRGETKLLLVIEAEIGASFGRTFFQENPHIATGVLRLASPGAVTSATILVELEQLAGFSEIAYDAGGARFEACLTTLSDPLTDTASPGGNSSDRLGAGDVLLVTGGGLGIGAECALSLARDTHVKLILMGRSNPATHPELRENLERFQRAGVPFQYIVADVTDPQAVQKRIADASAILGPVTAILHGAGINQPKLISALTKADAAHTFAPKVSGLANILAAVDPAKLKLLACFGSIIARIGLKGEADYAFANECLARDTDAFAARHPQCRCLTLEWTIWSGAGMGERLGRVDALLRQGISPIPVDRGIDICRRILLESGIAGAIVISSRFGLPETLVLDTPPLPLLRFLERPRIHYPGIELVVDVALSHQTDPYLADHIYHDSPIFPAVMGLEAIAQAAMALCGSDRPPTRIENLLLDKPIIVGINEKVILRIAVLQRANGVVEAAIRCDTTGFHVDHFRALAIFDTVTDEAANKASEVDLPALELDPARELYGSVFFHTGRFHRIQGYRHISAFKCVAEISPSPKTKWFGAYQPRQLVLGDPGARDACLHGIQVCVPNASILPLSLDRLEFKVLGEGRRFLIARETKHDGDIFHYDLRIVDEAGSSLESWRGVRFKRVQGVTLPADIAPALVGAYFERTLCERTGLAIKLGIEKHTSWDRRRRAETLWRRLAGTAEFPAYRPDGKPVLNGSGQVSFSHSGNLTFALYGPGLLACDIEATGLLDSELWKGVLSPDHVNLGQLISKHSGEPLNLAMTRVWTAIESLKKAGIGVEAHLVLDSNPPDGWIWLRSGRLCIATLAFGDPALVLAALVELPDQGRPRTPISVEEDQAHALS